MLLNSTSLKGFNCLIVIGVFVLRVNFSGRIVHVSCWFNDNSTYYVYFCAIVAPFNYFLYYILKNHTTDSALSWALKRNTLVGAVSIVIF